MLLAAAALFALALPDADARTASVRGRASFRLSLGRSLPAADLVSATIRIVSPFSPPTFEARVVEVKGPATFWVRRIPPGGQFRVEVQEARIRLRYRRREIVLNGGSLRCGDGPLRFPASVGLIMPLVLERRRGPGTIPVEVARTDGKPVGGAFVRVFGASARGRPEDPVTHVFTAADGTARAAGLLPGRYRLELAHPGRWAQPPLDRPAGREGVEVPGGGTPAETVRFELEPAGELVVRADRGPYLPAARARVALRLLGPDGVWREPDHPEVTWTGKAFRFTGLPPGRCQVRLLEPGCAIAARIVTIRADRTVACKLRSGRALPALEVLHGGELAGARFHLGRYDAGIDGGGARATLGPDPASPAAHGIVPGRYLAFLPDRQLAMVVRFAGRKRRTLELAPPEARFAAGGDAMIRVGFHAPGAVDRSLLLGLAPRRTDPLAHGSWLRTARPVGTQAAFERVPEGVYDLLVFDSVLGTTFGFGPDPIHLVVQVGAADVEITLD
ncbi:MAG: carboxypeptidase-like regulatory domain-containing protein, partial [Planctomycetota bacterium]